MTAWDPRLAASSVGKRLSTADPLTPHDVAERLDRAAVRVWRIISTAENVGPDYIAEVCRSRYLTNALPDLRGIIHKFLTAGRWDKTEDPETVAAVAWALFADGDANYHDGEHVPSATELELATLFVTSLRTRGYDVTPARP